MSNEIVIVILRMTRCEVGDWCEIGIRNSHFVHSLNTNLISAKITLLLIFKHQWITQSYQEENAALLPYAILCLVNDYESWKSSVKR